MMRRLMTVSYQYWKWNKFMFLHTFLANFFIYFVILSKIFDMIRKYCQNFPHLMNFLSFLLVFRYLFVITLIKSSICHGFYIHDQVWILRRHTPKHLNFKYSTLTNQVLLFRGLYIQIIRIWYKISINRWRAKTVEIINKLIYHGRYFIIKSF